MRTRTLALIAAGSGVALVLAACGANQAPSSPGTSGASSPSGGGTKVGVILPETATSARWEGFDKPILTKELKAQGLDPNIQNALGDDQKFSTLADGMISSGVKVLIIAPTTPAVGAAVERKALTAGIPVINYDRLSLGGSAKYYVSFDNVKVGELQGKGLVQGVGDKPGANIIQIEGAPTDNNATMFTEGQMSVLKPKYDSGAYKQVANQPVDGWKNQIGGQLFEQILTSNGGRVDGVVAANDGLAGAVISVLKKNGLNGKVPVTGQDATADGLMAILRGDQYMTVFKPIDQEAKSTAQLAAALAKNDTAAADKVASSTVNDKDGKRDVKSALSTPILITKDNVKSVVDAGFVQASEICGGDLAATCQTLGIH